MQGIYKITCLPENRCYVGSSTNINRRWSEHKRELNSQRHRNIFLQLDWDCYGDENFIFEIIETTSNLVEREHYWLQILNNNYNIVKNSWNPMREKDHIQKMMDTKRQSGKKLTFRQKLLEQDVKNIIIRVNNGESDSVIAKDYNVLRGTIWSIKTGNTWKHLFHLIQPRESYEEKRNKTKKIGIELFKQGYSKKEIAKRLNRKAYTVNNWVKDIDISKG